MSWRVEWTARARRDASRLDPPIRARVADALDRYAATEQGDVIRLRGVNPPELRLRVGDWRVRFARDTDKRTLYVLAVRHREAAY